MSRITGENVGRGNGDYEIAWNGTTSNVPTTILDLGSCSFGAWPFINIDKLLNEIGAYEKAWHGITKYDMWQKRN